MEKILYMKNERKSGIFSSKNAGTWRSNGVVPDFPADYVGRPPRLGKLVELLLTEEACRMREARQEERGNFFLQKCSRPGTRRTWWLLAAMRCVKVLDPARGVCDANAPEMTTVWAIFFAGQSHPGALEVVLIAAWTQTVTYLALSPGSER